MSSDPVIKVLVADDSDTDRLILESILRKEGHQVLSVSDGHQALEAYSTFKPDILLLDVLMPVMSGIEATKAIRKQAGSDFVPILFLTSLTDTESFVACLEAGGDDFISKPYNKVILKAKIKSFYRMRQMHETVQAQRDEIADYNARLLNEQEVAKVVFDNVAREGSLDSSIIRQYLSPKAVFNGDIFLSAFSPSGTLMVLLGDFTGHGLPAAIGAIPLASLFYSMVGKGFSLQEILKEANSTLNRILPVGFFCCGCVMEIDFAKNRVKVWNGGLPDCFLHRCHGAETVAIASRNLPLGILPSQQFKVECEFYRVEPGDRLFLWSDGIIESTNCRHEMYGEQRLKQIFASGKQADQLFDAVIDSVLEFIGSGERRDDISMVELTMCSPELARRQQPSVKLDGAGANDWSFTLELRAATLKTFNPSHLLLAIFHEVPGLISHLTALYTVVSELFSNALDHGVLELSSALKHSPEGFNEYYRLREKKLAELKEGFIVISLEHRANAQGGELLLRMKDSGTGFDVPAYQANLAKNLQYSGRGLGLLHSICKRVMFNDSGNEVSALFEWTYRQ